MRVLDAGVVVDLLVGRLDETALGGEEVGVPHLLDSEVTNVLRRLVLRGDLTAEQGDAAMARFLQLDLERFPADRLRPRMWDLREDLTAYDATYVALAGASPVSAVTAGPIRRRRKVTRSATTGSWSTMRTCSATPSPPSSPPPTPWPSWTGNAPGCAPRSPHCSPAPAREDRPGE